MPLFVSYYRRSLPRFAQVKRWLDCLSLHGSAGTIRCSVFEPGAITLISGGLETVLDIANPVTIQLPHVKAMRRHLDGEMTHPSLAREAIKTTRLMEAILGSTSPLTN